MWEGEGEPLLGGNIQRRTSLYSAERVKGADPTHPSGEESHLQKAPQLAGSPHYLSAAESGDGGLVRRREIQVNSPTSWD